MVRSLSRGAAAGVALLFVLAPFLARSAPTAVSSPSELRACLERLSMLGPVDCVVDEVVTVTTSGAAVPTAAIFGATLPTTNRVEASLRFTPTGCFVWNHTGAEPTTTSTPVRILEITAPSGVDAGSRLRIDSPCIREQRAGVDGGSAATDVRGLVLTGAGRATLETLTTDPRIAIASTGDGSTTSTGAQLDEPTDGDGNGLFEDAFIWDADGDGSGYVTCSAKDVPDLACKAAGEVVYRDRADDTNCAIHGCGYGKMEPTGRLRFRSGVVYLNFPCWDAREPAGFNNPAAANDDLRDNVADAAYTHCPVSPDGRRLATIALLGWQGVISGGGSDTRNPETTSGYKRDVGTYFVDDRGPNWNLGAQANLNAWFSSTSFIHGFNFGFNSRPVLAAANTTTAGELSSDGDSTGSGVISGAQLVDAMQGQVCVCEDIACGASVDNWAQGLVAGDIVEVHGTSQTATFNSDTVVAAIRVRDVPSGTTCNGAGTTAIPLGGRVTAGTAATSFGVDVPLITQVANGFQIVHARSDYLQSRAVVENVTFEPQDRWNETGGDCSGSGVWTFAADGALADFDCDTNPQIGFFGGGAPIVRDVVFRGWHVYAIDGNSGVGNPRGERLRFFYGNGGQVADPGTGWNLRDLEIRDSQFETSLFASYGPGVTVKGLKVYNSPFDAVVTFQSWGRYNRWEDIEIYNSPMFRAFSFACGAKFNVVDGIRISGQYARKDGGQIAGAVVRMECADPANPIEFNTVRNVSMTGGGGTAGSADSMALVVLDSNAVIAGSNSLAIRENRFEGFNFKLEETGATWDACLFAAQDDETTDRQPTANYNLEELFANNVFFGNAVRNSGAGTDRVYCHCGLFSTSNETPNECESATFGSGAGGEDARGCMNQQDGAAPAGEVCS